MERHFVVQFENRPGQLAQLARELAARGVNITDLSCLGMGPLACAFLTTNDPDVTRDVLRTLDHEVLEGATVVVELPDEPGALARAMEVLAAAGVEVQGTMTVGRRDGLTEVAFSVTDEDAARAALDGAGMAGVR